MQEDQLNNTDSEDLDDLLRQIELSFDIQFGRTELQHLKTFGELCDIIENKIQLTHVQNCTSQQAFYKLRSAMEASVAASAIAPYSQMAILLPIRERKIIWRSVEKQLGFKLNIIGVSTPVAIIVFFAFLTSFAAFFFSTKVAVIGLLISALAAIIATKTGNTLQVATIRDCVEKMTRENYLKSRRNSGTFNREEITKQVQKIFLDGLALPASALNREATFV